MERQFYVGQGGYFLDIKLIEFPGAQIELLLRNTVTNCLRALIHKAFMAFTYETISSTPD